jgi:type II secretory pathway component GspD/PulD (secretin)
LEFGLTLDITPTVLADGYTISLPLVVSSLEFLGYEDNRTNRVTVYVNGKRKEVIPPQPIVRSCQITSQANVWDGQTLVLGGLVSERVIAMTGQLPVLGNLPGLGPLFRSESKNTRKRSLLVFITPTIVDPSGNRVHSDEEMPLSRDAVPRQPAR